MRRVRWFVPALLLLSLAPATAVAEPDPPLPTSPAEAAPAEAGTPLTNITSVTTGYYHSCALLTNHQVRCWGYNAYGQLGNGNLGHDTNRAVVTRNASGSGPLTDVIQISAGIYHTCALLTNHQVRCWGEGENGALGNGHVDDHDLPVAVRKRAGTGAGNLTDVVQIAAGGYHTCALLSNGQARCWGENENGNLGDDHLPDDAHRPSIVRNPANTGPLQGITSIAAGYYGACATLSNHQARCWGWNDYGQVGDGEHGTDQTRPVVVRNEADTGPLTDVASVDMGHEFACARLLNRQVRCWGQNDYGQLGNDDIPNGSDLPVTVLNVAGTGPFTATSQISIGAYLACARMANGQARCWADGEYGGMGNGSLTTNNPRPTVVLNSSATSALTGITQLDTGYYTTCARLENGTARCWGYGQLGNIGNGLNNDNQPRTATVTVA